MTSVQAAPTPPAHDTAAFAERLFGQAIGAFEALSVDLGDRLGLYAALAQDGPATPAELAARAGIDERYAREWLEQQAVAEVLELDDAQADPAARRYGLPAEHAEVLADADSLAYLTPLTRFVALLGRSLDDLAAAFRSGGGVPYAAYGPVAREAQAAMNRPQFLHLLGQEWLPAMPDVDHLLRTTPGARVADVACGAGWSSIAIARAYPGVTVHGYDADPASIELARANVRDAALEDRVQFQVRDAADPTLVGDYHLACVFEALHDMARPVEALATLRRLTGEDGAVLVVDERTNDELSVGDDLERFFYVASVLFCLPTGRSEAPSAATGTVMRTHTMRDYASRAGFASVEVLPIEHDVFRFYRLRGGEETP